MMTVTSVFEAFKQRTADIHLWAGEGKVQTWTAAQLRTQAQACCEEFERMGVAAGDTVVIAADTSLAVIACIFGAWGCGAAVAIPPPLNSTSSQGARGRFLEFLRPKLFVSGQADETLDTAASPECAVISIEGLAALAPSVRDFGVAPCMDDVALIQMTSGSTGLPKGIGITHKMLAANCAAIVDRTEAQASDHAVSWLPLNHDMGFGVTAASIMAGLALTLIPSSVFMRSPSTWFEAISRQRGSISASPAFACSLMATIARRLARTGVDLSSLRYLIVGAEPIFAAHLQSFETAMRPFGLRENVVKPAYGLAEAVVAVTCTDAAAPYRVIHVDGHALRTLGVITKLSDGTPGALPFVSNGKPLPNYKVKIVDQDGMDAPSGIEGSLYIAGPSVAASYMGNADADKFHDEWFDTGDLGFIDEGEVFICGRRRDLIIRGGVNISPSRIEWAVEELLGLRQGQVATFSVLDHEKSKETIVAVIGKMTHPAEAAQDRLRIGRAVADAVSVQLDHIVFVRSSCIPRTTSGKVQRTRAREMFLRNEFSTSLEDSHGPL
jgi:acyl-CoA synthetase (AMP-forming)/AMP-acid ligase II